MEGNRNMIANDDWKEYGKKGSMYKLKYYFDIDLEGLRKIPKAHSK
jgi:hypothetical protein